MSEQKKGLTFQTSCANNDLRTSSNGLGNRQGLFDPPKTANANSQIDSPPVSTETRTIPLRDRSGITTHRQLTRVEWSYLYEKRLVTLRFTSRSKRQIAEVRLAAGVSVAEINSALRMGMRSALPRAEDNKTTIERRVEGGGIYYDHIHVEAWNPNPAKRK